MILLTVATAIQFVVLLALAVVVLSLARQVGILHERLSPAGMTRARSGLEPGQAVPELSLVSLAGTPVSLTGAPTALLFLSSECPICRSVLPAFRDGLEVTGLRGLWVADGLPGSDGDPPDYAGYVDERGLDPDRFLISQELGLTLGVRQLPALVLLDGEGRLLSSESVNGPRALEQQFRRALGQPATPIGEKSR